MSNNNQIPCNFTLEELIAIKNDVEHILNAVSLNEKQQQKRIEILNKINELIKKKLKRE